MIDRLITEYTTQLETARRRETDLLAELEQTRIVGQRLIGAIEALRALQRQQTQAAQNGGVQVAQLAGVGEED